MTPSLLALPQGCAFQTRCQYAEAACKVDPPVVSPAPGRAVRCIKPLVR
jgi:peptide/nickel transport system ATP-binding protein